MSEESTTLDLVERVRLIVAAVNRQDLDALMGPEGFYAPDVVFDMSERGLGIFEGKAACLDFVRDWFGIFNGLHYEVREISALPNRVVFGVVTQRGHPIGVNAPVDQIEAWVSVFSADGLMQSFSPYVDIDEGRAAAERLAEERG